MSDVIKKRYMVINIRRLAPFRFLIELEPEKPTEINVEPEKIPETDEEKVVVRTIKALQSYGFVSSRSKLPTEVNPCYSDNNLEIIINSLDFNVGDIIELCIKRVG